MINPDRPRWQARAQVLLLRLLGVAIVVVVWELVAAQLGQYRLPSLVRNIAPQLVPLLTESRTLAFQGGGSNGLWPHLVHTTVYTILGFALGSGLGVLVALLMARFAAVRDLLRVPIEFLRTVPPLAAIPFLLIWIGPTLASQLALLVFYTFVMVVIGAANAIDNLDRTRFQFARTLGASLNRSFTTVIVPSLAPAIVGTLRVTLGVAWGIQVVAEMLAGTRGMGQVFVRMVSFQALDIILVGIILVTVVALLADIVLLAAARRVTRWTPRRTAGLG